MMELVKSMMHPPAASSHEMLGLLTIFEPGRQIAIVERAPNPSIMDYLAAAAPRLGNGFRIELKAAHRIPLHPLPEHTGRDEFAEDLAYLAEAYCDLMGCPAVGLRLEVIDRAMCPRFHVDHTGIRLLCTYRGTGTEWLEDECADRSKLGHLANGLSDEDSGIVLHPAGVHQIAPFSITLLKGSAWQGNTGGGIIHRSPAVDAATAPRVLLALDALW